MRAFLPTLAAALLLLGGEAAAPARQAARQAPRQASPAPARPPAAPAATSAVAAVPGELELQRLNRTYRDVVTEIAPIRQGPVTVRLSSPRQELTVRHHLLRLEPGSGGSHSAELRVDFSGKGWLVADVDVAGMGSRLEDEVTVPSQSRTVEGRVRIRKVAQGYVITPEQLPRQVAVRIQSGVGTRIVGFCDRAAALLADADCGALDHALSTAVVPLPAPGEDYLLEPSDLTAAERQQIDSYLAREGR